MQFIDGECHSLRSSILLVLSITTILAALSFAQNHSGRFESSQCRKDICSYGKLLGAASIELTLQRPTSYSPIES